MPLDSVSSSFNLQWGLARPTTGFADTTNKGSITFNARTLSASFNQLITSQITLAGNATASFNLKSLENLVCESVAFTSVIGLVVKSDKDVMVSRGASSGIPWMFPLTSGIPVYGNGYFSHFGNPASTGYAVTNSQKTFDVTNLTSQTATVIVGILGAA